MKTQKIVISFEIFKTITLYITIFYFAFCTSINTYIHCIINFLINIYTLIKTKQTFVFLSYKISFEEMHDKINF